MEMHNPFGDLTMKTPNDMSEAEEYYPQEILDKIQYEVDDNNGIVDLDVLQPLLNDHFQHKMREVLEESKQLIFKESESYKNKTASGLELQRIGFKHGAYWLLNHLKTKIKEG